MESICERWEGKVTKEAIAERCLAVSSYAFSLSMHRNMSWTPNKEPLASGRALWISGLVVTLARLALGDSGLAAVPSASRLSRRTP